MVYVVVVKKSVISIFFSCNVKLVIGVGKEWKLWLNLVVGVIKKMYEKRNIYIIVFIWWEMLRIILFCDIVIEICFCFIVNVN